MHKWRQSITGIYISSNTEWWYNGYSKSTQPLVEHDEQRHHCPFRLTIPNQSWRWSKSCARGLINALDGSVVVLHSCGCVVIIKQTRGTCVTIYYPLSYFYSKLYSTIRLLFRTILSSYIMSWGTAVSWKSWRSDPGLLPYPVQCLSPQFLPVMSCSHVSILQSLPVIMFMQQLGTL